VTRVFETHLQIFHEISRQIGKVGVDRTRDAPQTGEGGMALT
jgi:hypothetical protein